MAPQPGKKPEAVPFQPIDAIDRTGKAGLAGFCGGIFFAAVENSLSKENMGISGVWRNAQGKISYTALGAATFGFVDAAMANLRGKDDHWNKGVGAMLGGNIVGLYSRQLSSVIGFGAFCGIMVGVMEYSGGRLDSYRNRTEEDEFEHKMQLRANRRRPIEETIAELGEGRGIRPPGYEERRKERIKEKYGFEIKTVPATVD